PPLDQPRLRSRVQGTEPCAWPRTRALSRVRKAPCGGDVLHAGRTARGHATVIVIRTMWGRALARPDGLKPVPTLPYGSEDAPLIRRFAPPSPKGEGSRYPQPSPLGEGGPKGRVRGYGSD